MAAPATIGAQQELALRRLERERKTEADEQSTVWGFLWTLFAFKIAAMFVIVYAAKGSGESWGMILATTWYWMIIPIGAIGGPMLVRWRMLKMRRKREQLQRSEWDVPEPTAPHIHLFHETPPDGDASKPTWR